MFPPATTNDTQPPAKTAGDGAANGGQQPPQTYTADQYHGQRGAYEQQLREQKAKLEAATAQLGQLTESAKLLERQKAELETKATAADTLAKQLADAQQLAETQTKLNSRLQTLVKYPGLMGPETMELVKNTTLEGEALEKVLGGLAAKMAAAPTLPPAAGGTPPQPPAAGASFTDLMNQANTELKAGHYENWRQLYGKALTLQNTSTPFLPPIDKVDQPGLKPPVG